MAKHILIMAFYQCVVMYAIVFAGEFFIPESPNYVPQKNGMVYPGRPYNWDGTKGWLKYSPSFGASRHMTMVFTTFVFMQIFNMLNARKIRDELNMFSGMFGNWMFIVIWIFIFII